MQIDQLKTPFRWYTDINLSTMRRSDCAAFRYKLITPEDRLLPFMFRFKTPAVPSLPSVWEIYNADTGVLEVTVPNLIMLDKIDYYRFDGWDYLIYKGEALAGVVIPDGFHYSVITMQDNTKYYSDEFWVDCDAAGHTISGDYSDDFSDDFSNSFVQQGILLGLRKYVKLTWFHSCDIGNILYQSGYVNMLYIDADMIFEEPEIIEEGKEDGNKEFVPNFVKLIDQVSLHDYMPEHVVNALTGVAIHLYAYVTAKDTGYITRAKKFQCTFEYESMCHAKVDLKYQQETILTRSQCCGDNLIENVYMCPARISGLLLNQTSTGLGTFAVLAQWNLDIGTGPFRVTSPQMSGGAPHDVVATNEPIGTFAPGTIVTVEVKPKCNAANGRLIFGNVLTATIVVG